MTELPESKIKFVVGLSNGESLVEGKGKLERIAGGLSPYHKMRKYLEDEGLEITSIGLWAGDIHHNLPSFAQKFNGLKPKGFEFFRRYEEDDALAGGAVNIYSVAEAHFELFKLQLWINENDLNKSWVVVKDYGTIP
jgi:hypothetical protein